MFPQHLCTGVILQLIFLSKLRSHDCHISKNYQNLQRIFCSSLGAIQRVYNLLGGEGGWPRHRGKGADQKSDVIP